MKPDRKAAPVVRCQVGGCENDIPSDRIYYKRYKICSFHSSLPAMCLGGQTVRWCQQCGRFQPIDDFDGDRRSCRRTLELHNARRRRSHADCSGVSSSPPPPRKASAKAKAAAATAASPFGDPYGMPQAADSSDWGSAVGRGQGGTGLLDMSGYPSVDAESTFYAAAPGGAQGNAAAATAMAAVHEDTAALVLDQLMEDAELQEMLSWLPDFLDPQQQQRLGDMIPSEMLLAGQNMTGIKAEPVELPAASRAAASTAATDMLWSMDAVAAGLDTKVPMDLVPAAASSQVLIAGMDGLAWAPLPGADPFSTSALTQPKQEAPGAPHMALGSSASYMSASSSAPLRSFSLPEPGLPSMPAPPSGPAGMQWPGAQQPPAGGSGGQQQAGAAQQRAGSEGSAAGTGRVQSLRFQPAGMPCQSVTLQPAMPPPSPLEFQEHMVRLSLKLFNITPDQLPDQLRQEVVGLVAANPLFVDSFVRPGCTHLTVVALVGTLDRDKLRQAGAGGIAQRLLHHGGWQDGRMGEVWAADMLVQVEEKVAVVRRGRLLAVVDAASFAPRLVAVRPVAIVAQQAQQAEQVATDSGSEQPAPSSRDPGAGERRLSEGMVTLWGYGIGGSHDVVICRQGGRVLDMEIHARGKLPPSVLPSRPPGAPGPEWVRVRPLGVRVGLLQFEVQRGGVLSTPISLVALPNMAAVVEAHQAQRVLAGTRHGRNFIPTLGWVLSRAEAERQASSSAPGASTASAGLAVNSHEGMGLALGLLMVAQVNRWRELARLLSPVNPTSRTVEHVRVASRCSTAPQLHSVLSGSAERVSRRTASTPLPGAQLSAALPATGSEAPIAGSAGEGSSCMASVNFSSRPSSQELDPNQPSTSSGASSSSSSAVLPPAAAAAAAAAAKCAPDSLHLSAGLGTPNCSAWDLGVRPPMVSVSGPLSLADSGTHSVSGSSGGLASVGKDVPAPAPAPAPIRAVFANRAAVGLVLDPNQPSTSSASTELGLLDAEEPGSPLLLGKLKTIKLDEVEDEDALLFDDDDAGTPPPPEKVGGFAAWVALQMGGLRAQPPEPPRAVQRGAAQRAQQDAQHAGNGHGVAGAVVQRPRVRREVVILASAAGLTLALRAAFGGL